MVGIRQTTQQQELTFTASPADVAAAVETALASVGEVTSADQQTGRITGKVKAGLKAWEEKADTEILISRPGDQTLVQIQTSRDESEINMHGAEKTMDAFLQALRSQPALAATGNAGW